MSYDQVSIGAQSKVLVNGVRMGIVSGTISLRGDTHDVTDTEVNQNPLIPQWRVRIAGLQEADLQIVGLYALNINPHNPPFNLVNGYTLASIQIYVHGVIANPYTFQKVVCDQVGIHTANPAQPNSWDFHGYSGIVTLPQ